MKKIHPSRALPWILLTVAMMMLPATVLAQGSVTEMTGSADLQRNLTPEQRAADFLAQADRSMRTAEKKLAELEAETDPKKRTKLAKKVSSAMERVERDTTSSLNVDPRHPRSLFMRGTARLWLGNYGGAKEDCNQAFAIDMTKAEPLLCYGQAAIKASDAEQGMATYRKLGETPGGTTLRKSLEEDLRQWAATNASDPASEKVKLFLEQEAS